MKRAYLIARQEYIKYVTRRGFLISVLLFPVWIGLVAFLPTALQRAAPSRVFTIIDRAGGYEAAVAEEIARSDTSSMLSALAGYARANVDMDGLRAAEPEVAGALDNPDDGRRIDAFRSSGGALAMLARMARFVKAGAPPFRPPVPQFRLVPAPQELVQVPADSFADLTRDYLTSARLVPFNGVNETLFAIAVLFRFHSYA